MVVEEWESEAAMGAHLTSEHSRGFLQTLSSVVAEPPQLYRYDPPERQLILG